MVNYVKCNNRNVVTPLASMPHVLLHDIIDNAPGVVSQGYFIILSDNNKSNTNHNR